MREINKVIVHCSDSDVPAHDDISVIRKWHVEERGWQDVGYHFYINKKGIIQKGRSVEQIGAHCKGHNIDSIGICLGGKTKFTQEQFDSLKVLIRKTKFIFGNDVGVFGHRDFNKGKTCPNFEVKDVL